MGQNQTYKLLHSKGNHKQTNKKSQAIEWRKYLFRVKLKTKSKTNNNNNKNYNSSIKWGVVIAYGEQCQISDL